MSNSPLVNYTRISPNRTSPRRDTIKKITIHHVAGNATIESLGEQFSRTSKEASSNYGIGTDGRVGMYVEEKDRAWTSSNGDNDHQAITIEVANNGGGPNWPVSNTALAKLIDLCVDICKRNGIEKLNYTGDAKGNLTRHNMFAATACPGPYLQSKFPYIANEVNKRLQGVDDMAPYVTVVRGNTLSGIASASKTTIAKLAEYNPHIDNVNLIHVGDIIFLSPPNDTEKKYAALVRQVITTPQVDLAELAAKDAIIKACNADLAKMQDKVNKSLLSAKATVANLS